MRSIRQKTRQRTIQRTRQRTMASEDQPYHETIVSYSYHEPIVSSWKEELMNFILQKYSQSPQSVMISSIIEKRLENMSNGIPSEKGLSSIKGDIIAEIEASLQQKMASVAPPSETT